MNDRSTAPSLEQGELHFEVITQTRKRLFGRRPKTLLMIQVSLQGYRMEFDYREIRDLADGPLIIEALSSHPEGDYFLASPTLIEPSSSVGTSLLGQQFSPDSLLLLQGGNLLAELSTAQQEELIAWLGSLQDA